MGRVQTEAVTKVEAALVALKDAIEDPARQGCVRAARGVLAR